jgi:cyclic pyranopterin phosphate synthase
MPVETTFMDESLYLSPEEIFAVVDDLCSYGLEEVRLTGGEPLMRAGFEEIIEKLGQLPLKKIGLTTNGIYLDRYLESMWKNGVRHLNISLDSLNEENFKRITRGSQLPRILRNIEEAQVKGFHIKINVVAMRGVNDHEFLDFVEYSQRLGIEVRFLELMRIGHALGAQNEQFISAKEIRDMVMMKHVLKSVLMERDSTSYNYKNDSGAQIGFIASESQAFCGDCSRWRLSSDGVMRACLLKDEGLVIRNKTASEREKLFADLLGMKPYHRPLEVTHQMNAIGG